MALERSLEALMFVRLPLTLELKDEVETEVEGFLADY